MSCRLFTTNIIVSKELTVADEALTQVLAFQFEV